MNIPYIPPYLKKGDTVGITCPASKMDFQAARFAANVLESWGFKIKMGKTTGTHFHNFSAADEVRLQDLQDMLDDPEVKAVLFGRGGYGMVRIIDQLNFTQFRKRPKWLCGYSDITTLHVHLQKRFHMASLHAMMCSGITAKTQDNAYVQSLRMALMGKKYRYSFSTHPLNRPGKCSGILTGGNLSLLTNASGTVSQPDMQGKILVIEDTGEYSYNVDRMMMNLKRAGWLDKLSGLLVGSFTEGKETDTPFGQTVYAIILDKVKAFDYPVAFNFPVGHQVENYALKLGITHELKIHKKCTLAVQH